MHSDKWTGESQPFRGDIWFAALKNSHGSYVFEGYHPVLVISNNETNYRSAAITVIPITSNTQHQYLPTQVAINEYDLARVASDFSFRNGSILLDQITTIDKAILRGYIGRVKNDKLTQIEDALRQQLGMG